MSKRSHKGHAEGHENAERWLLTYADLITLLMVFFVVLYSMSSADSSKWKQISAALEQAFNVDVLRGQTATSIDDNSTGSPAAPIDNLIQNNEVPQVARIQAAIQSAITQANQSGNPQQPEVTVGTDREGVVIRLSGSYLFDSGRAELKPNSFALLDAIAGQLKLESNDIRVDGHTDSTPLIGSALYPTNWELSTARALAVTRYLTETDGIQATRMEAAGYGEFRPIAPNDTRENRALNRRVEIHLLSTSPDDHALAVPTPQTSTGAESSPGAQTSTGAQASNGSQHSTGSQDPPPPSQTATEHSQQ